MVKHSKRRRNIFNNEMYCQKVCEKTKWAIQFTPHPLPIELIWILPPKKVNFLSPTKKKVEVLIHFPFHNLLKKIKGTDRDFVVPNMQ